MTREYLFQSGQRPWNIGTGGCRRGHDPALYQRMPSGVYVCLGCKRENGAKYRQANRESIRMKSRAARYDLTVDEYKQMFEEQHGRCAICDSSFDIDSCRIDHNHETGEVRGLLCAACNTAIGLLKDSPDVLIRAAKYVKNNGR